MTTNNFSIGQATIEDVSASSTEFNNGKQKVYDIYVSISSERHKNASFFIDRKQTSVLIKKLEKLLLIKKTR